ncbi:MAG: ATP-binding protein [Desulforhopalus sp.]|nr:ATP-binding protein [Desulforhopalus sp.]
MSFRNKLGFAFGSVVAIMVAILLVVWWSMDTAMMRQKAITTFSLDVYKSLYAIGHEQFQFIITQKMQHAITTSELLEDLTGRFVQETERFVREGVTREKAPTDGLVDYREEFRRFSVKTVELETAKSRVSVEAAHLFAASSQLAEQGEVGGTSLLTQTGQVLLVERDYLLTLGAGKAAQVVEGVTALERLAKEIMQDTEDRALRLKLFRIVKAAATYRTVFTNYLREQEDLAGEYQQLYRSGRDLTEELQSFLARERQYGEREIARLKTIAVAASLLALLVAVLAALILADRITKPIEQLKISAQEILGGNLATTVDIVSRDEVGSLGRIFNQMIEKLRTSFDEILRYRDRLEEQVAERTQALQREVEERRDIEHKLRIGEEQLRMIIDQSPLGVIVWDNSFRVVRWNKMAERIFGYRAGEAIGLPATAVMPAEMHVHLDKIWTKLIGSPAGVRSSNINLRKNGETIQCDWFNTPIYDRSGAVMGALSLVQDATERIRAEEEGLKLKKLESTGILAGGIAHDFNNILTAILGNLNLSLQDEALGKETHRLLVAAEKASLRAKDLTQQLLTFAKGGEPIRESTSLREIIEDSAGFVLHGSNVSCHNDIPGDLWPAMVDRGQISQVIQNIVINARHAMPNGGVVRISCENIEAGRVQNAVVDPDKRYVKITIGDTGIGIPQHLLDKIFDPYFTTKQEGSGLGLAITLAIVNKHNGHIFVHSTPGQGTEFAIYLPAADGAAEDKPATKPPSIAGPRRVLVMDDEQMVREVIGVMLRSLGHEVLFAAEGGEAVALVAARQGSDAPVGLVIVDLTIPGGMGGMEAMRQLHDLDPALPVIVASGYSNDPVMASYRDYGFSAAVAKPFVLSELRQAIENALNRSLA